MLIKKQSTQQSTTKTLPKNKVLSQEELMRWWPFTRLDPKRFPKPKKPQPTEYEEAPF